MKVIIIEDEKLAAQKLRKAILSIDTKIEITCLLSNIKEAVNWFRQNPNPDLILMDIALTDGLSLKIFDEVDITCPVIFTTAYDEYWQEAFEHNGIDYLLKPIRQEKLESALKKYAVLKNYFTAEMDSLKKWQQGTTGYKKRFLVKTGPEYLSIKTEDIAYFFATHKLVCLVNSANQKFILDQSLSEIEGRVDPSQFSRANRKFLVNISAIKRLKAYPKGKLLVELYPPANEDVIVSQENALPFKEWLEK